MQSDYIRRKFITLLGSAAAALLEIAFAVAVQGIALLSMIAVIVALITIDLVILQHAFSLSGGRWEQALVLTINTIVIVILIWSLRRYGKLRQAEQSYAKNYRQQRERATTFSEESERQQRERAATFSEEDERQQRERAAMFSEEDERQQREQAAMLSEKDEWWTILEVSPDASVNDIRRSYLRKIRQYHPDRVVGLASAVRERAERRSKTLNAAYAEAMRDKRSRSRDWINMRNPNGPAVKREAEEDWGR
jgi:DnaJ-domain-containing protein 1